MNFFGLLVIKGASPTSLLPHLGASMLYLHNAIYGAQSTINPVAWTLEIEVQFYCLMPLMALLFLCRTKWIRRMLLVVTILMIGIAQLLYWDGPARAKLSLLYAIQFFLAGLLLADIYVEWGEATSSNWRWDLLSCICWLLIFLLPDRQVWVFLPYLMLLAYFGAFRGVLFGRFFRNRMITAVGGMCYTIYLVHYQMLHFLFSHIGPNRMLQAILYSMALSATCCAFFLLVERPCMKKDWPPRLWCWARNLNS